jgi:hypothetical protein
MSSIQAEQLISEIWGCAGVTASRSVHAYVEAQAADDTAPLLDRLLRMCDPALLDAYNRAGRPLFCEFREWWNKSKPTH